MSIYPSYNYESKFVEIGGHRLHYVDEGEGDVLLMLHGNPTWSYLYRHLIKDLRSRYRCIALDHLGFGFSDKPIRADQSIRAHIMRLDAFIERLALKKITLVVQDWGGVIGLNWAAFHKRLIERLVIMNTTAFVPFQSGRPISRGLLQLLPLKIPILGELFVQGMNGMVRRLLPLALQHRKGLGEDVLHAYADPYPTFSSRRAQLALVRQIPIRKRHPTYQLLMETAQELCGWGVPTQLIWGMRDPVFTPHFLSEFERLLPNHRPSLCIEDAGHFLQEDRPDLIVNEIQEFLAESSRTKETPTVSTVALETVSLSG